MKTCLHNVRAKAKYETKCSYHMEKGTIKRLTDKGFGFIEQEGNDKDLFFHATVLVDVEYNDLREGDAVTFDTEETPRGLQAVNVKKA